MSDRLEGQERETLGEAGHIGAGRVACALERMMGEGSHLTPPRVGSGVRPLGAVEVGLSLEGVVQGEIVLNLTPTAVRFLLDRLLASDPEDLTRLSVEDRSVLEEVANVVGCSYLMALSEMTGLSFQPSVPKLRMGGKLQSASDGLWVASKMKLMDAFDIEIVFSLEGDASAVILGALGSAA